MTAPTDDTSGAAKHSSAGVHAPFAIPAIPAFVRELRDEDGRELEWQGGIDLRSFYQAQWDRHSYGEATVLVVDWNTFPIAQAAIYWQGKPTHPGLPDIQSFRVFPAFRGMGIGSKLLDACEDTVAARGYNEVSLSVGIENPRARALYERRGYEAAGEPYFDEWNYLDARGELQIIGETILDLIKRLS